MCIRDRGYEQWAKIHNLKQAAKTMNFLTENKIEQYADLVSRIEEMAAESGQAADALKNACLLYTSDHDIRERLQAKLMMAVLTFRTEE